MSPHVTVRIDLEKIRASAMSIHALVNVPVLAVVKADAYGLGALRIVQALNDVVDGFCVLTLREAIEARIRENSVKPIIALAPEDDATSHEFVKHQVRPAVWEVGRAAELSAAHPVLSIDTGMQRFACPAGHFDAMFKAFKFDEAFTHATKLEQVERLRLLANGRGLKLHAAGSSLLHEPAARLDVVRPGLALYEGAVRVATRLVDARKSAGPVGYTGFTSSYHGIIRAGYSHGLRTGPCLVNNRPSRILEVGMQSAYVETIESDRTGDEVVFLGDSLRESMVADAWKTSRHEVLTRMCAMGMREYA